MVFRDKSRSYETDMQFSKREPDGDTIKRDVCDTCGFINYENPKIVAGIVASWERKILMCRRNIEPRKGFWTLPAGFMEQRETTQQAAAREAHEEAHADIEVGELLGIYNIARISQVQIFYRGKLKNPNISAGPESMEVALFDWDDIPWDELAFPSVYWALQYYKETRALHYFPPAKEPDDWFQTPGFEKLTGEA